MRSESLRNGEGRARFESLTRLSKGGAFSKILPYMKLNLRYLLVFCSVAFSGYASAAEAPAYPLKTCVVSGEKLGGMGKPAVLIYEGREVQFCCKACIKDFNKDPKKFIALLDAAKKAN